MVDDFIAGIPKAELHLHIEGTLEPELKFILAERNGVELPYATVAAMKDAYDFDDLPSFLAQYYEGMSVLLTEADFYDLAWAYFFKAASQGVVYAEVFFDPQAHTDRGIDFETVLAGLTRAQTDAASQLGLRTQLIMCFLRDLTAESAMATLEAALAHKASIVGVGLDSDERGNPPGKFAAVFARARHEGFRITAHCDVDQENSTDHIWQCVRDIEVERIDHGVNCLEDVDLVAAIKDRGLGLTVCPISNSYVAGSLKADSIKKMLDHGLKVTINSDDPAYFPGYMTENLMAVAEAAHLERGDVAQLCRNAFDIAWLPEADRRAYIARVDAFVAAS
ncbi:MAG: adenosine deaminase [Acidimicrobiia bacterium]